MSYSQSWLEDTTRARGVLVIAQAYNVLTTLTENFYFSNIGFNTTSGDVSFNPIISSNLKLSESLSFDNSISVSYGDIEVLNPNGEYDTWLDNTKYVWANKPLKVYYGDPAWTAANIAAISSVFNLVFDGVVSDIDSRSKGTLNFKIVDKQQRLNGPVTETVIGTTGTWSGGQTNQDQIQPLVFGEVHNITPVLTDPSLLKYLVCQGGCESIIEIRDNGVPIYRQDGQYTGAIVDLNAGTFTLKAPAAGTITCSVQGKKTTYSVSTGGAVSSVYINNVCDVIRQLITEYGIAARRLTASDINIASFQTLLTSLTATTGAVGVYITDRENLLELCQKLAGSVGAQIYFTRTGLLKVVRLVDPLTATSTFSITTSDIVQGSLNISNRTDVQGAAKVAYAKNWTVQQNLATNIPSASKESMATEWLLETQIDSLTTTRYQTNTDPTQKDTLLIALDGAIAEATRLLNYFKATKTCYRFTGTSRLLSLELGQIVNVTHSRFGLSGGKNAQVISLSPDWSRSQVEVEVVV